MLIGPGEFWADEGRLPASEAELDKSLVAPANWLRAYERFGAQGIYVSPQAQAWLAQDGSERAEPLPAQYLLPQEAPLTRLLSLEGRTIALVFLPAAHKKAPAEMSGEYQAALAAGRAAAREAELVIAVSPWGSELERAFAAQAEGIFHILLGGGPGYGFASALAGERHGLLWARPEDQGRSLNVIEILDWPAPAAHSWENGLNYQAHIQLLSPDIPPDPAIVELFPEAK